MTDSQFAWLALSLLMRNSPARAHKAIAHFGTPSQVWQATADALQAFGFTAQGAQKIIQERHKIDPAREMERVVRSGASLVTFGDAAYPAPLRSLDDAPLVLYVRGTLRETDAVALAMVGTRTASRYGLDAAYYFATEVARHRVTVISGLAEGIDTVAHRGAIDAKGRTLALLGSGIDVIYPRENERLAAQIMENGAILSEYPLGMPPMGSNFPRRNRLISGLSRAVLVVEAPESSGALITATAALEQGRDVFAVPGLIFNPNSVGANRLIQDGAKIVLSSADILNEFGIETKTLPAVPRPKTAGPQMPPAARPSAAAKPQSPRATRPPKAPPAARADTADTTTVPAAPADEMAFDVPPELSEMEGLVYQRLSSVPIDVDEIIRDLSRPAGDVLAALTILELKGLAENTGAMQYSLARS